MHLFEVTQANDLSLTAETWAHSTKSGFVPIALLHILMMVVQIPGTEISVGFVS